MKKVAILIDGEWFRRCLESALGKLPQGVTADVMYRNCLLAVDKKEEELFRIFYYDCPPYGGRHTNPIDKSVSDFKTQKKFASRSLFISEMKTKDYVAMRMGIAKNRGWTLTNDYTIQAITNNSIVKPPTAKDVFLSREQKGVDMRIGIDVATLSLKRIVERIILISGDTDMIPAMKLARREGVQVILVQVHKRLSKFLDEDADLVRVIKPTP